MEERSSTDFEALLQDYATEPVPAGIRVSGARISSINTALAFSLPGMLTGIAVVTEAGARTAIWAFLLGGAILSIVGFVTGFVGVQRRLSSYMLIREAFGPQGARLVNLCIALSMFGWFGVNLALFTEAASSSLASSFGPLLPPWLLMGAGGALMTAAAIFGFKSIQKLSAVIVPLQLFVLGALAYRLVGESSVGELLDIPGASAMGLGGATSAVVGSFIVSAMVMPDLTRYGKTTGDALTASVAPFLGSATLVYMVSAAAALVFAESDVLSLLQLAGIGVLALLFVLLSSTITNAVNLYGCGLSVSAVTEKFKEWQVVLASGIAGTIVAFSGIFDRFIDFIFSLGIIFMPIGAIFSIHYFLQRRGFTPCTVRAVSWPAMLAWIAGVLCANLTSSEVFSLSQTPAIDALLTASVSYLLFLKLESVLRQ